MHKRSGTLLCGRRRAASRWHQTWQEGALPAPLLTSQRGTQNKRPSRSQAAETPRRSRGGTPRLALCSVSLLTNRRRYHRLSDARTHTFAPHKPPLILQRQRQSPRAEMLSLPSCVAAAQALATTDAAGHCRTLIAAPSPATPLGLPRSAEVTRAFVRANVAALIHGSRLRKKSTRRWD